MTLKGAGTPNIPYRADIDGLRAIAVLSVVVFHANYSLMPGGFVGVDVFFVISGFLISGFILNRLKDGSFSYVEFYERRIRRIFPALIVVLVAVWGLGWFTMLPAEFAALGKQIVAGAAFAGNIVTFAEVGYFDVPASTKPLLHLWSLGVEEQFYFVFPALLVLIWRYRAATLLLAVIGIASFALNVAVIRNHPSFAFYLPMTRFWEFIAGALLTNAPIGHPKLDRQLVAGPFVLLWRDILAATGLLLIFVGFGIIPADNFYPGWWALVPVLGTFLVIGAGEKAWSNSKVLANPKLVFVGLISYPFYLWHWPLIVIAQAVVRDSNPTSYYKHAISYIAAALAFGLAWLTYQFIERPIRKRQPLIAVRRIAAALAACLVLVALVGFTTMQSGGLPGRYPKDVQALLTPLTVYADFPLADESKNIAGPLLITYGDSHAQHLQAGLRLLQNERTFRLMPIGWGCAPVGDVKAADEEGCRKFTATNEATFSHLKPDIVVISAFWYQYKHIERLSETLRFFQRIGVRRIVVIGTVPFWPEPPQMLLYKAYRSDPLHPIPRRLFGFNRDTIKVDERLKEITSELGVTFISAHDVLCNEHGCLVRVGDAAKDIIQVDLTHFSAAGSWFLVSHIADQIFN